MDIYDRISQKILKTEDLKDIIRLIVGLVSLIYYNNNQSIFYSIVLFLSKTVDLINLQSCVYKLDVARLQMIFSD